MRLVGKLWPETRFVVTNKIFKLIISARKVNFLQKAMCHPRQEAKLLVYL